MKLTEEKIYYSEELKTNIFLYKQHHSAECQECGKPCKNPWCFTREDDEDNCEYIVGSDCIKKYKLIEIK